MLRIFFDQPSQEDLDKGLIPLLYKSIKEFGNIDLGYTWSSHLPTETFVTFHCCDDNKCLFSSEESNYQFYVNEASLNTLINGFLRISNELIEGKATVTHMFLDGSGELLVERLDQGYIRITFDSYKGIRSLDVISIDQWHTAVRQLGYDMIALYDKYAPGIQDTEPFKTLKIKLDHISP